MLNVYGCFSRKKYNSEEAFGRETKSHLQGSELQLHTFGAQLLVFAWCYSCFVLLVQLSWNGVLSYLEQNRWSKKAVQSLKNADALSAILFFKRTESVFPIITFACVWAKCLHGERFPFEVAACLLRAYMNILTATCCDTFLYLAVIFCHWWNMWIAAEGWRRRLMITSNYRM